MDIHCYGVWLPSRFGQTQSLPTLHFLQGRLIHVYGSIGTCPRVTRTSLLPVPLDLFSGLSGSLLTYLIRPSRSDPNLLPLSSCVSALVEGNTIHPIMLPRTTSVSSRSLLPQSHIQTTWIPLPPEAHRSIPFSPSHRLKISPHGLSFVLPNGASGSALVPRAFSCH